mmetsp:Transcript_13087/g.21497  ORF Transcript_13087/g.21497 Transcript_13087/m.21497 type:complete len:106 (+) Transcript_13087:792-1109(+)
MTRSLEKAQTFNRLFNCIPLCLRLLYQRKGPRMEQRQKNILHRSLLHMVPVQLVLPATDRKKKRQNSSPRKWKLGLKSLLQEEKRKLRMFADQQYSNLGVETSCH